MHPTVELRSGRWFLMGGSMLAMMLVAPSLAQAQQVAGGVESVTVTGYAASLQKATDAKRDSTNFTDTISQARYGNVQVFTAFIAHHDHAAIRRHCFKHERHDLFECFVQCGGGEQRDSHFADQRQ